MLSALALNIFFEKGFEWLGAGPHRLLFPSCFQTCLVCRKGDDDENLLLCDSCDRGCHLYCHRPKMTEVPAGDWFCSLCIAQVLAP